MTTAHDHRVDIFDAFTARTDDLRTELAEGNPDFLDVTVWRADDHEPRVEFLLGCGGPTDHVTVDLGTERVEYFHSWGRNAHGEDWTDLTAWGDEAAPWLQAAGWFTE